MTLAPLAAIGRVQVADYVNTLITVYIVLIFIRILMSYFRNIPYYRALDVVLGFVTEVTDPWLNLFRRFIPPVRMGPAALDLTPMIAVIALLIISYFVTRLIRGY
jgi:YggT family protein